ncbi:MAG TPA: hypothetical protein PK954_26265, partial [Anaerolineales bacterium]|nr:hypothetical protein [Anaerolineales bacterium]
MPRDCVQWAKGKHSTCRPAGADRHGDHYDRDLAESIVLGAPDHGNRHRRCSHAWRTNGANT